MGFEIFIKILLNLLPDPFNGSKILLPLFFEEFFFGIRGECLPEAGGGHV